MKETTIITTVEITEVLKNMPDDYTVDKKSIAEYTKKKIGEVISADDIVVANVQEFEMEKE